jgi:ribosomal protein L24
MNNPVKILLAEDEPSLGQIIKESLETRNFEVLLCEDGEQAYKKYKSDNPLLLVLDVMMPKKDGFTLAKEIRNEDPNIPIIFLTAKSQVEDVVEGFNLAKKHVRANPQEGIQGGIEEKEMPLSISNVAIYNPTTKKADRIGVRVNDKGVKERFFKSSGEAVI